MDVSALNKSYEYLQRKTTEANISQYSNVTVDNKEIDKASIVHQVEKDSNTKDNKEEDINKEEMDAALKKLNKFLEDEKTHAEYEKHEDLGTMMVRIIEDDTDKVVVELPPKKVLDMIASICKQVGILDKKA